MIHKVDFQMFTFCNRSCEWCPPFTTFRPKQCNYITDEIFFKTIDMINENSEYFSDELDICLSRYCEPTYDIDLMHRYSKILKENFPKSSLSVHTNGDYLTKDKMWAFEHFDVVYINRYEDDHQTTLLKVLGLIDNIDALATMRYDDDMKRIQFEYNGVTFRAYHDRGKTLFVKTRGSANTKMSVPERDYDCDIIGKMFMVEWNGDVLPCCDTIGFIPQHNAEMNCGNVLEDDFDTIYSNIRSLDWKAKDSCKYCHAQGRRILGVGCFPTEYGKTH